jgi:hypothetical protein
MQAPQGMRFLLLIAVCGFLPAQTPSPKTILENTGKPMKVTADCKAEEVLVLGLTCSQEDPCPLFLELSDVELVNDRLFVSGNLHTGPATLESILLMSHDLGKTWTEPVDRIPGSGLDEIQFIDFEAGWVSGQIQQTLPRDPFLLLTTDGGKTWRKRTVSGETRVGAVERFYFTTRTSGLLLLDKIQSGENGMRHELYESMTGGESWSLRQVSPTPIPFRYPKTQSADWRVRADAASKSYRIERRQGERWQTVASFLISAGECKPEQRPDAPPPEINEEPVQKAPEAPRTAPSLKKK